MIYTTVVLRDLNEREDETMRHSHPTKLIISVCVSILVLCIWCNAHANTSLINSDIYIKLTIVIDTTRIDNLWLISCEDSEGQVWAFWDDEDRWVRGDIVNLLMTNVGQEQTIIEAYWEGHINDSHTFLQLITKY